MRYRTFIRNWYRVNKNWTGGLEPHIGRSIQHRTHDTREEARAECDKYNDTHKPGKLSRKMEFEAI